MKTSSSWNSFADREISWPSRLTRARGEIELDVAHAQDGLAIDRPAPRQGVRRRRRHPQRVLALGGHVGRQTALAEAPADLAGEPGRVLDH